MNTYPKEIQEALKELSQECKLCLEETGSEQLRSERKRIFDSAMTRIHRALEESSLIDFLSKKHDKKLKPVFYLNLLRIIGRSEELWDNRVYETTAERNKKYEQIQKTLTKLSKLLSDLTTAEFLNITPGIDPTKTAEGYLSMSDVLWFLRSSWQSEQLAKQFPDIKHKAKLISESPLLNLKLDHNTVYGLGVFNSIYRLALEPTKKDRKNPQISFRNFLIRELHIHLVTHLGKSDVDLIVDLIFILQGELLEPEQVVNLTKNMQSQNY